MAFSTQKQFFHVPFMNETVDFECRRACVELKSYDSTMDDRAWALDETNRSRFLTDLVTCKTPVSSHDIGDGAFIPAQQTRGERGRRVPSDSRGVNPADSLIAATNVTLDKVQNLLQDKRNLQQKLEKSEENLKTAKAEYDKIREILNRKFDRSDFKDFYNRIQKMATSGIFTKKDENDFLEFFKKMEDLGKAYEVSQAENSYLKRLLEKLSRRAEMDKIPIEPETSKDIPYLQDQVNKLRKELMTLRKLEDNKMNIDECGTDINVDANNLNIIIRERNALRERLRAMQDIEKQVCELKKRLCDASDVSNNLSKSLDNKSKYIGDLECEMREMQAHYEKREEERNCKMECFRRKFEELKRELCSAKLEAQKVQCLKAQITRLEESNKQKDRRLCDYDSQFKQLMCVINELRCGRTGSGGGAGAESQCSPLVGGDRQDCTTQTAECIAHTNELAYYTSATLNEIKKELRKRGITGDECGSSMKPEDCCKEVERLRKIISELQGDKTRLSLSLMERNKCLDGLTSRLDDLCNDFDKSAEESEGARENLNNALDLVGSISQMQEKNQKLMDVADKISKKEMDDLINDLEKRLKSCLEDKEDYRAILEKKGFNLEQELKAMEESRKRGTTLPRQPADVGPLVGKPKETGAEEYVKRVSGAPDIDQGTAKPKPGAGPGAPSSTAFDMKTEKPTTDGAPGAPGASAVGGPSPTATDPVSGKPVIDPKTGKPISVDPGTGKPVSGEAAGGPRGPDSAALGPVTGKPMTDGSPGAAAGPKGPGSTAVDPATGKAPGAAPTVGGPSSAAVEPATGKPIPETKTGKPTTDGGPAALAGAGGPGSTAIDPASGKPTAGKAPGAAPTVEAPGAPAAGPAPGSPAAGPATGSPAAGPAPGKPGTEPKTGKPTTDGSPAAPSGAEGPGSTVVDPTSGKPTTGKAPGAAPTVEGPTSSVIDPATGKPVPGGGAGAPGGKPMTDGAPVGGPSPTTIDPVTGKPVIDPKTGKAISVDPVTGKPITVGRPSQAGGPSGRGTPTSRPATSSGATTGGRGAGAGKAQGSRGTRASTASGDQYTDFVSRNAANMALNIRAGNSLQKELRKILDAFVDECRFCLCQSKVPKSKFYAICHKILHEGIMTLSFNEIAYIHKKIYYAAEKLYPGCLLNVILTEYAEVVREQKKCCNCKSVLCCDSSQEMLKDKVRKLEVEVELAKDYLESIRARGRQMSPRDDDDDESDCKSSTYRQGKPLSSPRYTTRRIKHIKACITKCSKNMK